MDGSAKSVPGILAETMVRVRKVRSDAQVKWRHARSAFQEARRMREKLDHQIAQLANDPLFHARYREAMLRKLLGAVLWDVHAEKGYIQRLDKDTGQMVMDAHRGLEPAFVELCKTVELSHPLCRTSVISGRRIIVPDISSNGVFGASAILEILLDAKVRSLQITPIFGEHKVLLGLLTTLWPIPRMPNARELLMIEHYGRSAGRLLETEVDGEHFSFEALPAGASPALVLPAASQAATQLPGMAKRGLRQSPRP
jgi:hypothetical protein